MKYSGLTYLIAFVLAIAIVIYQYSVYGTWLSPYLLIPVILGVTGYTLGPQIDWWFYKRFPPKLDDKVKRIFEINSEFYRNLPPEKRNYLIPGYVFILKIKIGNMCQWMKKCPTISELSSLSNQFA